MNDREKDLFERDLWRICSEDPEYGLYLQHLCLLSSTETLKKQRDALASNQSELSFLSSSLFAGLNSTEIGRNKLEKIWKQLDHAFIILAKCMDRTGFGRMLTAWIKEHQK